MTTKGLKLIHCAETCAKHLELRKIHLWNSKCHRNFYKKVKKFEVSIEIQTSTLKSDDENILPFSCSFKVIGTNKESTEKIYELEFSFCAVYATRDEYRPSTDECKAFSTTSAIFNIWPYARQYLQDMLMKMDLPPFVLPPITVSQLASLTFDDAGKLG